MSAESGKASKEQTQSGASSGIRSRVLEGWVEPARVFSAIYGKASYAAWLDAGDHSDDGHSYMGAARHGTPLMTASVAEGTVTSWVHGAAGAAPAAAAHETHPGTIFDALAADLAARGTLDCRSTPGDAATTGFRGGWVGWLGFELGAQTVNTPMHHSPHPDAALFYLDQMIDFDHAQRTMRVIGEIDSASEAAEARGAHAFELWADSMETELSRLSKLAEEPTPEPPPALPSARAVWRHSPERYERLIAECQAAITRGDAYQLCLTNTINISVHPDPLECYRALRAGSPSHHGGLLRFGDTSLLSASPEQFLQISTTGVVTTKPIKGTRKRGSSLVRDIELRAELESSEKERAENLMIVDLMRNDLGRIAELGSVRVQRLLAVESYPHVHQLVSTVQARLKSGLSALDAVAASFPAGSMTGAPKISAMTILHELEAGPRGLYAGVFGYLGRDGAVDLAMVIRSIVLSPGGASIGTGGGITALSVPSEEVEETQIKARALLAALGVTDGP